MGFVLYVVLLIVVFSSIILVAAQNVPIVVTGTPDRQPNQNGWYTEPVTITWTGHDKFGNLFKDCKQVSYSGPDGRGILVKGYCNHNNRYWSGNLVFNYDSTPPTFPSLTVTDIYNKSINSGSATYSSTLNFSFSSTDNLGHVNYKCSLDNSNFVNCNSPEVISLNTNQHGVHYFQVNSYDSAGNTYGKPSSFSWTFIQPVGLRVVQP